MAVTTALKGMLILLLMWPAMSSAGEITLAWDANSETDLAGYKLYYDGDSDSETYYGTGAAEGVSPIVISLEDLATPDSPVFTLTGLTTGEYYYLSLTAFNTDGVESDFSDEVGVTIGASADSDPSASGDGSGGSGCFITHATEHGSARSPFTGAGLFLLLTLAATCSVRKATRTLHLPWPR